MPLTNLMNPQSTPRASGFTLIELLVVIAIIGILAAMLLPVLAKAKVKAKGVQAIGNFRNLSHGWHMYSDENDDLILPGRFGKEQGGSKNPKNWYEVGNGLKYRPRWVAYLGTQVGVFPFKSPSKSNDRQDYDHKSYINPLRPIWKDERNYSFGYNYQFLGNGRFDSTKKNYVNFPVYRGSIQNHAGTVMAASCMGTAAGCKESERVGYLNQGKKYNAEGNHGWSLDPPRLTSKSDKGSGDKGSPRTAVDPCINGKAIVAWLDGSVNAKTPEDLGYRRDADGKYLDSGNGAHNKFFSGTAEDDDPPIKN